MLLDLYFHHQNSAPKSGVNRLWLIEYYTRAFAEKEATLKSPRTLKAKTESAKLAPTNDARVESLVAKAEADLEALTQGIKDVQAAQQFTHNLIKQAQASFDLGIDFMTIARDYKDRLQRDDDELLLLSMVI